MNFFEYLFLRFCHSPGGKAIGALLVLPLLILVIPVLIVITPFLWVGTVYSEWKDLEDEE